MAHITVYHGSHIQEGTDLFFEGEHDIEAGLMILTPSASAHSIGSLARQREATEQSVAARAQLPTAHLHWLL